MIRELYIENLAVIEKLNVQFEEGLTVFTGETGAGKSILIDAINLVLGQRSTKDIVRTGTKKAVVSALLTCSDRQLIDKLEQSGYEAENGELLISREISADGKGTARLMGRPVTVGVLRELGNLLINIHGQHDSQVLLSSENHIDILDAYAASGQLLGDYQKEYSSYAGLKSQYKKISMDEQDRARRIDLLSYQTEEIMQVNPKHGEDTALQERLNTIRNFAKISDSLSGAYQALTGGEELAGGCELVGRAGSMTAQVGEYSRDIARISEELEGTGYELTEIAQRISGILEKLDFNPQELEELESRLAEIDQLKRKYGSSIEEILDYYEKADAELQEIQMSGQTRDELADQIAQQKKVVLEQGRILSDFRRKAAHEFSSRIAEQLRFLDMPNVSLQVQIDKAKYGAKGCDTIEFLFSTNKGEQMKSISKIASGGELSRIMLAIKNVLAEKDAVETLIFDEIDAGVSGKSAQKIGLKLRSAACNRQVLCVTHSAQIAALAQHNFLIQKQTQGERTYTNVVPLDEQGKISEVARIMSTGTITGLMLQNAKEMVEAAKEIR